MDWSIMFFFNSALLGVGLAIDAFSVSLVNGFNEPNMKHGKRFLIPTIFAIFQFTMPMIGWLCVHFIVQQFAIFEHFIPWIALLLLSYIGGKMLVEYFKTKKEKQFTSKVEVEQNSNISEEKNIPVVENNETNSTIKKLTFSTLIVQGIATSIDALSVGFTIAEYTVLNALVCGIIIAIVTFGLCVLGVFLGRKFGTYFERIAGLIGGIILIGIGLEIFIKGMIELYA